MERVTKRSKSSLKSTLWLLTKSSIIDA